MGTGRRNNISTEAVPGANQEASGPPILGVAPRQETTAEAYCRGREGPLLSSVGEVLFRPLGTAGCELVLGLDRLPDRGTLSRLAGRKDLARLIELAESNGFPPNITEAMRRVGGDLIGERADTARDWDALAMQVYTAMDRVRAEAALRPQFLEEYPTEGIETDRK